MGDLISGAPQQKHRGILTTEMFFQPLQRNFHKIESVNLRATETQHGQTHARGCGEGCALRQGRLQGAQGLACLCKHPQHQGEVLSPIHNCPIIFPVVQDACPPSRQVTCSQYKKCQEPRLHLRPPRHQGPVLTEHTTAPCWKCELSSPRSPAPW